MEAHTLVLLCVNIIMYYKLTDISLVYILIATYFLLTLERMFEKIYLKYVMLVIRVKIRDKSELPSKWNHLCSYKVLKRSDYKGFFWQSPKIYIQREKCGLKWKIQGRKSGAKSVWMKEIN